MRQNTFVMLASVILLAAALRAPDEFPPLAPVGTEEPEAVRGVVAGACSMWLALSTGTVRASGSGADELSLRRDLGLSCFAVPFPVRIVYKREKTAYEFSVWHLSDSGSMNASRDFVFDGVAVTAGQGIKSDLSLGFFKLAYRRVLWDSEDFRLLIDAGADLIDFDVSMEAPGGKGSLDPFIPLGYVGLELEARVAPQVFLTLRTTGLSWSDMLGVQGDLFSVQGTYRHLEIGALWQTSLRTYLGASYRFLQLGFVSSGGDSAVDVRFQGLAFTARYWW